MNTAFTKKNTLRSSLCRALLPLAVASAVAVPTFVGERDAAASGLSSLASGLAKTFVENTVVCALSGAKNLGSCILTGSSSTSSSLSENDIYSIASAVNQEFIAFNAGSYASQAQTLITNARAYQRGASVAGLAQSQTDVSSIIASADTLLGQCSNTQLGLSGAGTYNIVAAIKVAFTKEFYEVRKAETLAGTASPAAGYPVYTSDELLGYRNALSIQTGAILTELERVSGLVDSAFGSVYLDNSQLSTAPYIYGSSTCIGDLYQRYCFSGPSGTTCSAKVGFDDYQPYHTSGCNPSPNTVVSSYILPRLQEAEQIVRMQQKIDYRKSKIGDGLFETMARYEKIVNGDFEYCGDGVCSVTDISTCPSDCVAGAGGAKYAQTSAFALTTGSPQRVLETSNARLEWQSDGNLVLYSKTDGLPLWATSTGGSGYKLDYQGGGNLVVYPSTGNFIWQSNTGAANYGKLALVGQVLHVLDASGKTVWNSNQDSHVYATLASQFCYDTSSPTTLLSNGFGDKLAWQNDGNLVVYDVNYVPQMATNTGGSGKYLCNQEDGTLAIYSSSGATLWSKTSSSGDARTIKLGMNHLQITSLLGSLEWTSSNSCQSGNVWACDVPTSTLLNNYSGLNVDVGGALLTDGASFLQWPAGGQINQKFKFVPDGAGYAFVKAVHSGKCMALDPNNSQAGAAILQETCSGIDGQRWQIVDAGGGSFYFKSKLTGMCLDVPGGSKQAGATLAQGTCAGYFSQRFTMQIVP